MLYVVSFSFVMGVYCMLYQFIIKVLMSNSDTVFTALVMGVFGYMGWLLWNINERLKDFETGLNKYDDNLSNIKNKMDKNDQGVYKNLLAKLDESVNEMDKLLLVVNDNSEEIEKLRSDILSEVKESTNEIKDIIMILLNNRARCIKNKISQDNVSNDDIYEGDLSNDYKVVIDEDNKAEVVYEDSDSKNN